MAKEPENTANNDETTPNPFIKNCVEWLWHNINIAQFNQLKRAAESGEFEQAFISLYAERAAATKKDPTAPPTDPASPNFDIEAFRQAILDAGGFAAVNECLNDLLLDAIAEAGEIEFSEEDKAALADFATGVKETAKAALSQITAFIHSEFYQDLKAGIQAVQDFISAHKEEIDALSEVAQEVRDLIPFLQQELDAAQNDPLIKGKTVKDLLRHGMTIKGEITESPFKQLIERAKQRKAEYEETQEAIAEIEKAATDLPRIISTPTDKINYPLDKPNSVIWNLLTSADPNGQIQMRIDTSRHDSKKDNRPDKKPDAIIYYGINFDEIGTGVTITRQLTPFDKRCYIAAAALFNAGNEILSATQVYYMMGNATPPNKKDLQKVNDSLTKMGAARVYIDNEQEIKVSKGYRHFKYDAALLPFERISAYINGQLTESAIHLFREPPLMTFARQRNQITTVSRQLLESPISKTDANLRIDDYLLERIGRMKNGKGKTPRKILFATLYKQCDIKTAKQKQRAPEKIRRYLDYYKNCGWIKGYTAEADGITILL